MNDGFVQIHISDLSEYRSTMISARSELVVLLKEHDADIPLYEKKHIIDLIRQLDTNISNVNGLIGR